MNTLTLHEIARLLKYKDVRSARRWCDNHNVAVLIDTGTKTAYVIQTEFNAARLKTVIAYLKEKYGSKWKDFLSAYISGDIGWIIARDAVAQKETPSVLGIHGSQFLSDLKQSLSGNSSHES